MMIARDETRPSQGSLNALAQAAKEAGIAVKGSQVLRILVKERVRWRRTHSWGTLRDKDFVGSWTMVVSYSIKPPEGPTTNYTDELGPEVSRIFNPAAILASAGHRAKTPLDCRLHTGE